MNNTNTVSHVQDYTSTGFPRDKKADRDRLERMYLTRQCTKQEFLAWLKNGGHNDR